MKEVVLHPVDDGVGGARVVALRYQAAVFRFDAEEARVFQSALQLWVKSAISSLDNS